MAPLSAGAACPDPVAEGFRGPSFPSGVGDNEELTAEKPESKLWFHDGSWWGSLWSSSGDAYHIHRLDSATQCWQDTGVSLDTREDTKGDVLWDGQKLYVVSHVYRANDGRKAPPGRRGELFRYSYAGGGTWTPDPGYPVEVNDSEGEALTIAKDSIGRLWVSYVEDQEVRLNHTRCNPACNDADWASPFTLPTANADSLTSDEVSAVVAFDGRVGVLWSNQNAKEMFFASHADGQAPGSGWTETSAYSVSADDHLNVKTLSGDPAGKVLAAIKTSRSADLIVLLVCDSGTCSASGDWESHTVYDGDFSPTRPILLLDIDAREAHVAVRNKITSSNREIYTKTADLDNPSFSIGSIGDRRIATNQNDDLNDPTSTKGNLSSATGMVILASNSSDRDYYHANTVTSGARIGSFSPTSGPVGTWVTILGSGFSGASRVRFAGRNASYVVDSDTRVRATVPAGAGSGPIQVTSPEGTATSASSFSVTAPTYTLTVSPTSGGSVSLSPSGGSYGEGTVVTLTANPSSGYGFDGWGGALSGTTNPISLPMNGNKTVSASFSVLPPGTYSLGVSVVGSGSVAVSPPGPAYSDGTVVTLTASPAPGFRFQSWSGSLVGSANPSLLTMNADKAVTASFVAEYTLSVGTLGAGQVSVSPLGPVYDAGITVTLTALPDPGLQFAGWSGDVSGTASPVSLVMNANKSVTASFALPGVGLELEELITGGASGSASVSTASALGAAAGHVYVASVASKPYRDTVSVSGLGLVWNELADQCGGRSQTGASLWWAQGTPTAAGPVTATQASAPDNSVLVVARYSGADGASPVGSVVSANTNGSGGGCAGGIDGIAYSVPITTGAPDALVVGVAAMRTKDHEPGAGWSEQVEIAAGSGGTTASVALVDRSFPSAGAASFSGSFNSTVDWAVAAVELRPQLLSGLTLSSFTPVSGPVGTEVTVTGSDFTAVTDVAFGGVSASYSVDSSSQLRATVPASASTGPITVTTGSGSVSSAQAFLVGNAPVVSSFSPASGGVGSLVTITGSDLFEATGVAFNGTAASFTVISSTVIEAAVPAGAVSGPISVTTPFGTGTSAGSFTVGSGPVVSTFSPLSGNVGDPVTIDGANLSGASVVAFNGTSASFSPVSDFRIAATVPSGATTGPIRVDNAFGSTLTSTDFVVGNAPVIAGFSPAVGAAASQVTVSGANLATASTVSFNGTSAVFQVISDSQITATVPAGATSGPIAVATPLGTATSATSFQVGSAPSLTGFTPASGPAGTQVSIAGTGLGGASAVAFNGTAATFTVQSDSQITASVPAGATTGPISVATPLGTGTSLEPFTVSATLTDCGDGVDNDGDGHVDGDDPGCVDASDPSERSTLACDDGIDNDGDGPIDTEDPGCDDPSDASEHSPSLVCDDGVDNDFDGLADYPADPGCKASTSAAENPECDDDIDNDGDGTIDWDGGSSGASPDRRCRQAWKNRE
jgi:hypothetical protein